MIRKLAEELMIHVYYPVSAVVSVDQEGNCLAVRMFDTMFAQSCLNIHCHAASVYLLSNHPEGYEEPYPLDLKNYEELRRMAGRRAVFLVITGEDIGCKEIFLPA